MDCDKSKLLEYSKPFKIYSLQKAENDCVLYKCLETNVKNTMPIYTLIPYHIPESKQSEFCFGYLVNFLSVMPNSPYIFVMICHHAESINMKSFNEMMKLYKVLPKYIKKNLKKLHILGASTKFKFYAKLFHPFTKPSFWEKVFYEPSINSLISKYPTTNFFFPDWIFSAEKVTNPDKSKIIMNIRKIKMKINLDDRSLSQTDSLPTFLVDVIDKLSKVRDTADLFNSSTNTNMLEDILLDILYNKKAMKQFDISPIDLSNFLLVCLKRLENPLIHFASIEKFTKQKLSSAKIWNNILNNTTDQEEILLDLLFELFSTIINKKSSNKNKLTSVKLSEILASDNYIIACLNHTEIAKYIDDIKRIIRDGIEHYEEYFLE